MSRSTKPSAFQENARSIAMDAFLEGKMTEGRQILTAERTRLSKPQAKKIAGILLKQGRFDDASQVLLLSMSEAQAKRELAPAPTASVGDILYTSWGWEQTNIDWYQVVEAKGASATIREIEGRVFSRDPYTDYVVPTPDAFIGPPTKKRVQKDHPYTISISDGQGHARVWDGKPKRQTGAGYGHATIRRAHARKRDDAQKFKVGDIVRRTAARMRTMRLVSGPVNGVVVGYAGRWPQIRWSDMSETDEPMTQAEEGLELDKRAMARGGHARRKNPAVMTRRGGRR